MADFMENMLQQNVRRRVFKGNKIRKKRGEQNVFHLTIYFKNVCIIIVVEQQIDYWIRVLPLISTLEEDLNLQPSAYARLQSKYIFWYVPVEQQKYVVGTCQIAEVHTQSWYIQEEYLCLSVHLQSLYFRFIILTLNYEGYIYLQ